jgi:hypothetical protein
MPRVATTAASVTAWQARVSQREGAGFGIEVAAYSVGIDNPPSVRLRCVAQVEKPPSWCWVQ